MPGPTARNHLTRFISGQMTQTPVTLTTIVRELYLVRMMRMRRDLLEGLSDQLDRPHAIGAFLMPACATLIIQTTGDPDKADKVSIESFAASIAPRWKFLNDSVGRALSVIKP